MQRRAEERVIIEVVQERVHAARPAVVSGSGGGRLFTRRSAHRVVAGVAAGMGARLGVDPFYVRLAFATLTFAGGAGFVAYLVLWAITGEDEVGARWEPEPNLQRAVAFGLQVLGLLLLLRASGWWFGDALVWPVAVAAFGSAVLWSRGEDREERAVRGRTPSAPTLARLLGGSISLVRLAVGALLVVAGTVAFLVGNAAVSALWTVAVGALVATAGVALLLGPVATRLARQLADERRERIRSEERAELAAHLHDSVLHTLALIQRTGSAAQMVALARQQERELRAWLQGRSTEQEQTLLSAALDRMANRVEALHEVAVEVVVVGDATVDERVRALVDAANEATVNAAKHSQAERVSVYVEVEDDEISAYIRDEGRGFDPDAVSADRRGITESIRGRMERHGGNAVIHSEPDEGTEVALRLPRRAS